MVNHVSALGCYYFDPEGNRSEVFWLTGRACWVPIAHLIDIHQSDAAVLAEVDGFGKGCVMSAWASAWPMSRRRCSWIEVINGNNQNWHWYFEHRPVPAVCG